MDVDPGPGPVHEVTYKLGDGTLTIKGEGEVPAPKTGDSFTLLMDDGKKLTGMVEVAADGTITFKYPDGGTAFTAVPESGGSITVNGGNITFDDGTSGMVESGTGTEPVPVASLVDSVWAGETPRAGDWLTISFKDIETAIAGSDETGLRTIWSFAIDNSTNNWGYTYDGSTKTGTISSGGWNPAPNGFTISADGKTLTITNYGSHEGAPRSFKRLRDSAGAVTITPQAIPAPVHLAGSVWAGETPRAGDWLTISFKNLETAIAGSAETGLRVVCSFAIDNSSNNWGYTYDGAAKTGTITTGSGWAGPAPGGFTVSDDGTTLSIVNYGGHGEAAPRVFKRLRTPDPVTGAAASPRATPAAGTYDDTQSVSLATATEGAVIHYTTDGSDPTVDSPVYSAPISVTANTTIKAIAVKEGLDASGVLAAAYIIDRTTTAIPTANPAAGDYTGTRNVTLSSNTQGAAIHYTTDGSDPTVDSPVYSVPISVAAATTIKAIAVKPGLNDSGVFTAVYTIKAATPRANPAGGTYTVTQDVTLTTDPEGTAIHYTTDGSTPTASSTRYTSAISVAETTTIKAIAVSTGLVESDLLTAAYTINRETVETPRATLAAGTYNDTQIVTLVAAEGATIHYTIDGREPTVNSPVYSPLTLIGVAETITIKAIAVKPGLINSAVLTVTYTIDTVNAVVPRASPAAGTYTGTQSVTLTSNTQEAAIHYTTDGSDPTTSSSVYSAPISVAVNTTIKAIAVKAGLNDSPVLTAVYNIRAATPTVSPAAGTYNDTQIVSLTTATSGAAIHYTTDGLTPTASSQQYTSAINVTVNTTIKAIAVKADMADSGVLTAAYTLRVATPTADVTAGTYTGTQDITLTTATLGAAIYYTTNGSTPTTAGQQYTSPISVTANTTLKAIAVKEGWNNSDVFTAAYVISIVGTTWYWGDAVLKFAADGTATINTLGEAGEFTANNSAGNVPAATGYSYTYDSLSSSGEIAGEPTRRSSQTNATTIVNALGPFTITNGGAHLTFSDYRASGYEVTFKSTSNPQPGLVGIIWYGPNFLIECIDGSNAILYALDGYYTTTTKLTYTYDGGTKSGSMSHVGPSPLNGNPGSFSIIENYAFTGDSDYIDDWAWRGGPKKNFTAAYYMKFSNWKNYGHGWDFVKLGENGIEEGTP
jgi:hypothetical protein